MIFRWTGLDLADRRIAHDTSLYDSNLGRLQQIDPYFYTTSPMNAVWNGT
jgi:hypothetical protein